LENIFSELGIRSAGDLHNMYKNISNLRATEKQAPVLASVEQARLSVNTFSPTVSSGDSSRRTGRSFFLISSESALKINCP
jgi:hypothetical protein